MLYIYIYIYIYMCVCVLLIRYSIGLYVYGTPVYLLYCGNFFDLTRLFPNSHLMPEKSFIIQSAMY